MFEFFSGMVVFENAVICLCFLFVSVCLFLKMILFDVVPSLQNTSSLEVPQLILTSLWFSTRKRSFVLP